ncbi:universal stress protein [Gelidibacter salicanalis]|uniref:Universal stress protein n=1 Tax=Gelidibacter salicanalis TaxID=291193 RepID=A0A934NI68_9FLAO|nr:universal stress protein [Gelidibacter salicanalis]MBJ7881716.1 universal stress protein [Gelidibacter salicanalis]
MNTILLPTDFSETANHALEIAVQLTKKFKSKLVLLHMLEIPLNMMPDVALTNDVQAIHNTHQNDLPEAVYYMKLAKKRFEELAQLPILKGIKYEEAVQNHLDFKGINSSAHKHNADLVVMGSHGATGFKEVFVGSNTEKVVRTSDIPVLVIKSRNENFEVKNFVYATNWEANSLQSLRDAYHLSQKLGANMTILYINTPGHTFLTSREINQKFATLLKSSNLNADTVRTTIYADRNIEEGILNFCNDTNADLIGVTTHGRKGLSHFLNQSISEDIANHFEIPVVTFKIG